MLSKLGVGAFAEIYKVEMIKTGQHLAAKVEKKGTKPALMLKEKVHIKKLRGKTHIPILHFFGDEKT